MKDGPRLGVEFLNTIQGIVDLVPFNYDAETFTPALHQTQHRFYFIHFFIGAGEEAMHDNDTVK